MAETIQARAWPLGSRMWISAGNPKLPLGVTGVRDAFTGDYIEEQGVVVLESIVLELTGESIDEDLEGVELEFLGGSQGVYGYLLEAPEEYGLEVGDVCIAKLVANAGVLAGLGQTARFLRLKVAQRY